MPTHACVQRGSFKECQDQGRVWTTCPPTHTRGQRFFSDFRGALSHDYTPALLKNDENTNDVNGTRVSEGHLQTADVPCWKIDQPRLTSEGLRQWEMHAHVDHVFDMVPFWQRGMDAAEKGEVLRLEEFLDKMEGDGGWRTAKDVLGMLGGWKVPPSEGGWGVSYGDDWAASQRGAWESNGFSWAAASQRGGWGTSNRIASDATESSRGRDSGWGTREKWAESRSDLKARRRKGVWNARVGAVGGGGREELHDFVDVIARQEAVNEERRKQMHLFFEMPVEQKIQKIEETIRFLRTHAA